jgi:primase-polymerase (primpol)-like protein
MREQKAALTDFNAIPTQMRVAKRWLLWRMMPNRNPMKRPRKVPFYIDGTPRRGLLDSPDDMARLATFDDALLAFQSGGYDGLGFGLGPDGTGNCWQGIDLDEIERHPGMTDLVRSLPGYVERSPSGSGVHAIGYGKPFRTLGANGTGIEAYAAGRYFTVAGDVP